MPNNLVVLQPGTLLEGDVAVSVDVSNWHGEIDDRALCPNVLFVADCLVSVQKNKNIFCTNCFAIYI